MKRHLVFYCTSGCKKVEMKIVAASALHDCQVSGDSVRIGEDEYIFFVDINRNPERIFGFRAHSYRNCGEYLINREIEQHIEAHMVHEGRGIDLCCCAPEDED